MLKKVNDDNLFKIKVEIGDLFNDSCDRLYEVVEKEYDKDYGETICKIKCLTNNKHCYMTTFSFLTSIINNKIFNLISNF